MKKLNLSFIDKYLYEFKDELDQQCKAYKVATEADRSRAFKENHVLTDKARRHAEALKLKYEHRRIVGLVTKLKKFFDEHMILIKCGQKDAFNQACRQFFADDFAQDSQQKSIMIELYETVNRFENKIIKTFASVPDDYGDSNYLNTCLRYIHEIVYHQAYQCIKALEEAQAKDTQTPLYLDIMHHALIKQFYYSYMSVGVAQRIHQIMRDDTSYQDALEVMANTKNILMDGCVLRGQERFHHPALLEYSWEVAQFKSIKAGEEGIRAEFCHTLDCLNMISPDHNDDEDPNLMSDRDQCINALKDNLTLILRDDSNFVLDQAPGAGEAVASTLETREIEQRFYKRNADFRAAFQAMSAVLSAEILNRNSASFDASTATHIATCAAQCAGLLTEALATHNSIHAFFIKEILGHLKDLSRRMVVVPELDTSWLETETKAVRPSLTKPRKSPRAAKQAKASSQKRSAKVPKQTAHTIEPVNSPASASSPPMLASPLETESEPSPPAEFNLVSDLQTTPGETRSQASTKLTYAEIAARKQTTLYPSTSQKPASQKPEPLPPLSHSTSQGAPDTLTDRPSIEISVKESPAIVPALAEVTTLDAPASTPTIELEAIEVMGAEPSLTTTSKPANLDISEALTFETELSPILSVTDSSFDASPPDIQSSLEVSPCNQVVAEGDTPSVPEQHIEHTQNYTEQPCVPTQLADNEPIAQDAKTKILAAEERPAPTLLQGLKYNLSSSMGAASPRQVEINPQPNDVSPLKEPLLQWPNTAKNEPALQPLKPSPAPASQPHSPVGLTRTQQPLSRRLPPAQQKDRDSQFPVSTQAQALSHQQSAGNPPNRRLLLSRTFMKMPPPPSSFHNRPASKNWAPIVPIKAEPASPSALVGISGTQSYHSALNSFITRHPGPEHQQLYLFGLNCLEVRQSDRARTAFEQCVSMSTAEQNAVLCILSLQALKESLLQLETQAESQLNQLSSDDVMNASVQHAAINSLCAQRSASDESLNIAYNQAYSLLDTYPSAYDFYHSGLQHLEANRCMLAHYEFDHSVVLATLTCDTSLLAQIYQALATKCHKHYLALQNQGLHGEVSMYCLEKANYYSHNFNSYYIMAPQAQRRAQMITVRSFEAICEFKAAQALTPNVHPSFIQSVDARLANLVSSFSRLSSDMRILELQMAHAHTASKPEVNQAPRIKIR